MGEGHSCTLRYCFATCRKKNFRIKLIMVIYHHFCVYSAIQNYRDTLLFSLFSDSDRKLKCFQYCTKAKALSFHSLYALKTSPIPVSSRSLHRRDKHGRVIDLGVKNPIIL